MRARVVEMERQKGFGKAVVPSGATLIFDVSCLVGGIPEVGAELEIELGVARAGGPKITRAEIVTWWEATTVPCLCLRRSEVSEAELLYLDGPYGHFRTYQPVPEGAAVRTGATGQLVLEHKRGAADCYDARVLGWSAGDIEAASRDQLLSSLHDSIVRTWDAWESVDRPHTADDLAHLQEEIALGLELGLDVDRLLTVTDYQLEDPDDPGPRPNLRPRRHAKAKAKRIPTRKIPAKPTR
jgi:hypothetical protein